MRSNCIRTGLVIGLLGLALLVRPNLTAAATIIVNALSDSNASGDGLCSLREAITNANAKSDTTTGDCVAGTGDDTIVFNVSGQITLGGPLPAITNTLTIDGTGQALTVYGANAYQMLVVNSGAALSLNQVVMNGGSIPGGDGGGVVNNGSLGVTNTTFVNNYAANGGAIANHAGATLTVTNSTFTQNGSGGGGGSIYNTGNAKITNTTFTNGSGACCGGILFNAGAATVTGSTFSASYSRAAGGGIHNQGSYVDEPHDLPGGTLVIANSTISGNSASWFGGALFNEGGATVTAKNVTIQGNSAGQYGGGIENGLLSGSGSVTLANSILSQSVSGNCAGTLSNGGYNVSDDSSCGLGGTTGANGQTLGDKVNPLLDTNGLQNNGGPTQTIALQTSSPAVAAIPLNLCPGTDQRGYFRPAPGQSACDVGSFELGAVNVITVSIEIKPPALAPVPINLSSSGVVPVAIISTSAFDATQVDPASVTLAGASVQLIGKSSKYSCSTQDVNGDGLKDFLCQVTTAQFLIQSGQSTAMLQAKTLSGQPIQGQEAITIVPQ